MVRSTKGIARSKQEEVHYRGLIQLAMGAKLLVFTVLVVLSVGHGGMIKKEAASKVVTTMPVNGMKHTAEKVSTIGPVMQTAEVLRTVSRGISSTKVISGGDALKTVSRQDYEGDEEGGYDGYEGEEEYDNYEGEEGYDVEMPEEHEEVGEPSLDENLSEGSLEGDEESIGAELDKARGEADVEEKAQEEKKSGGVVKHMHLEYTTKYPTSCACILGTSTPAGVCLEYTVGNKCKARKCKRSYVCIDGVAPKHAIRCLRKKNTKKIVSNNDGTCATKSITAYTYVPYTSPR